MHIILYVLPSAGPSPSPGPGLDAWILSLHPEGRRLVAPQGSTGRARPFAPWQENVAFTKKIFPSTWPWLCPTLCPDFPTPALYAPGQHSTLGLRMINKGHPIWRNFRKQKTHCGNPPLQFAPGRRVSTHDLMLTHTSRQCHFVNSNRT